MEIKWSDNIFERYPWAMSPAKYRLAIEQTRLDILKMESQKVGLEAQFFANIETTLNL